eukprot:5930434-Pleurochrysis_carterae.AAC.1
MGHEQHQPTTMHVDNSRAMELSKERQSCQHSRHVDRRDLKKLRISATTLKRFFHKWAAWVADYLFANGSQFHAWRMKFAALKPYILGLAFLGPFAPLTVSMDIPWHTCHATCSSQHKANEGCVTKAFNVSVIVGAGLCNPLQL